MKVLVASFLSLTLVGTANGMTLESFKNQRNTYENRTRVEVYLIGIGQGFTEANAALNEGGQRALFCPPEGYRLNTKNFVDIIKNRANQLSLAKSEKVADVLLDGLIELFPCQSSL